MSTCPSCGQPFPVVWKICPETNSVLVGGRNIRLTSAEMTILRRLLVMPGCIVERDTLIAVVSPKGEGRDASNTLSAFVGNLRRKLGHAPLAIRTHYGIGYSAVVVPHYPPKS